MNWKLALVTFAVIPFFFAVTNWFRRGSRQSFREVRKWIARINAFLQENLTGMSVVQLFRREERNAAAFAAINRAHADANVRQIFYYAVFYPAIDILAAVAIALILIHGGGRGAGGRPDASARWWPSSSTPSGSGGPSRTSREKFNILQAAMAASERIFTLLDTPAQVVPPARPVRLAAGRAVGWPSKECGSPTEPPEDLPFRRSGARRRIHFAGARGGSGGCDTAPPCSREKWTLKDIDFTVEPGKSVALVGATGAGKTSVISLLTRFYDVQKGRVTLDGIDVRDLDPAQLRSCAGPRPPGRAPLQRHHRLQHPPGLRDPRGAGTRRGAGRARRTPSSRPCPRATTPR